MKRILFLALTWTIFSGFAQKNIPVSASTQPTTSATIDYLGDPSIDGLGWVLTLHDDKSIVVPTNLPNSYLRDGLTVLVDFVYTGEESPCHCIDPKPMVEITDIQIAR